MDIMEQWHALGCYRLELLDRQAVEGQPGTVVLALFAYQGEARSTDVHPWIHPYYFQSHRAYLAHRAWLTMAKEARLTVLPGEDIRLKHLFHRMEDYTHGHNTLCYAPGIGSRFHVRVMRLMESLSPTCRLGDAKETHCGSCTRCIEACPTGAIHKGRFEPERCIRCWQLSGQPIPLWIRTKMGNRLVGCDDCQRVCPHNPPAGNAAAPILPLHEYLSHPENTAAHLRPLIGANLTISNRVLGQACIIASNSGDAGYLPLLHELAAHPSPVVADHSAWAVKQLG